MFLLCSIHAFLLLSNATWLCNLKYTIFSTCFCLLFTRRSTRQFQTFIVKAGVNSVNNEITAKSSVSATPYKLLVFLKTFFLRNIIPLCFGLEAWRRDWAPLQRSQSDLKIPIVTGTKNKFRILNHPHKRRNIFLTCPAHHPVLESCYRSPLFCDIGSVVWCHWYHISQSKAS